MDNKDLGTECKGLKFCYFDDDGGDVYDDGEEELIAPQFLFRCFASGQHRWMCSC